MSLTIQTFTAAQIASVLGKTKRAVLFALEGIPATSRNIVQGQRAFAWSIAALPTSLQSELIARAEQRGYRNAEAMLIAPPNAWQSPIPLAEIAEGSLDRAIKLQRALLPFLEGRNDLILSAEEFEKCGVEEYKKEFGHEISTRHFRNLLNRTLDRDGGAENWTRLEIFLDENPARKTMQPVAKCAEEFSELQDIVAAQKNPPSAEEIQYLWLRAFQLHDEFVDAGKKPKKAKLALLKFLTEHAPSLSESANALRVSWKRKYERWIKEGRKVSALADGRRDRETEKFAQESCDKIIAHAVFKTGGRISQAWREIREEIPELDSRYLSNPDSKSHVPRKIREAVKYEVAMLEDIHHGPRTQKLNGPHIERDYSKVFSMDWLQADDCTLPVYYREADYLMRGQLLLMIDFRSTRILQYALLSSRNYTARAIRSLITKTCDEFGLPRRGFYFEGGIWKKSRLLKGDPKADPHSWDETELGLRGLGLEFRHARLPRAKPVERVLGAVQNFMEGMPGYVGRNEMLEKFERVQRDKLDVEARRIHPGEKFFTGDQWEAALHKICKRYNAEVQNGKMTAGLSPDEAFEKFKNHNDPPTRLPAYCRYLLADHKKPVKVSRKGEIRVFNFVYRNDVSARLAGQTVLTWFSSETPDVLTITDMNKKNAVCIPRRTSIDAMDAAPEALEAEHATIASMLAYPKERYRTLKSDHVQEFRRNIIDEDTIELGMEILTRKAELRQEQKLETKARKVYGELGARMPSRISQDKIDVAGRLTELLNKTDETPDEFSQSFESAPGAQSGGKKEYVLKSAVAPALTTGQFWSLWKKVEAIKPGISRHALTQKHLGYHPKVNEMTQDELAKMVRAFSAIIRDSKKAK